MKYLLFLLSLSCVMNLSAGSFSDAIKETKKSKQSLIVLIDGASWHEDSRLFVEKSLPELQKNAFSKLKLLRYSKPDGGEKLSEFDKANRDFRFNPRRLPALVLFDAEGRLVAKSQDQVEDKSIDEITNWLKQKQILINKRNTLWQKAASAKGVAKAKLLGQGLKMLNQGRGYRGCYNKIYDEIKKNDPQDKNGYLAHFDFNRVRLAGSLNELLKAKKFDESIKLLKPFEGNGAKQLTLEQQQYLNALYFGIYRRMPEKKHLANAFLKKIVSLDKDSIMGLGAEGYLDLLTGPVDLVHGWRPHHFKTKNEWVSWKLNISKEYKGAGLYQLGLNRYWSVGRNSLRVKSIKIISDGQVLYSMTKERNVKINERIELGKAAGSKIEILIEAKPLGGTDSWGTISIKPWYIY